MSQPRVLRPPRLAMLVAALAASAAGHACAADYLDARYRTISAVDCVDASNMVAEYAPAPTNATYLRVQHVGNPGTPELAGEISNPVTWDVGAFSGLHVPSSARWQTQRGYRDADTNAPASAFQLDCNAAGFLLDSRTFAHGAPVVLAGPSVSAARDLDPPASVFGNATSALTIDARVRVPWTWTPSAPVIDGTAQVSLFYYARDTTSGLVFAHVIGLYDNRVAGTNGAGGEAVSADEFTPFVGSPLDPGASFVTVSPLSATMQFVDGWSELRDVRAHVTYAQFAAMLAALASRSQLPFSLRPEDYRVLSFGWLGEIFPGTGTDHEVALGASVQDLALSEASYDLAPVAAVEYYNAAQDHYFFSTRAADIEALDSGRLGGWTRTGATFGAYPAYASGTSPVCRYYLPPAYGDSHFFSASRDECADVAARFPGFLLEDAAVMYVALPDATTGACPPGTSAVYRLWNGRVDTNHRYTASAQTRRAMIASGWQPEGYGPLGVAMCAPPV